MTRLKQSLLRYDADFIRVIASLWHARLPENAKDIMVDDLCRLMLAEGQLERVLAEGSEREIQALQRLIQRDRLIPEAEFSREFGLIKVMGAERRFREKPWLNPESSAEWLFDRGLIFRLSAETGEGLMDCIALPDELEAPLKKKLPKTRLPEKQPFMTRPATPAEVGAPILAKEDASDLCCLLLAALRMGAQPPALSVAFDSEKILFFQSLLRAMKIIGEDKEANAESIRQFLLLDNRTALLKLAQSWRATSLIDELRNLKTLAIDESARYHAAEVRKNLLKILQDIALPGWWSMSGFLASVEQVEDDFLRKTGEAGVRLIYDAENGEFIGGEKDWKRIEGEYIRYFLCYPLHWLGMTDLAAMDKNSNEISAFRFNETGIAIMKNILLEMPPEPSPSITRSLSKQNLGISVDGQIACAMSVPRPLRYQIARFCEWEKISLDRWIFRITPKSLSDARAAGLSIASFSALLSRSGKTVPNQLMRAIEKWGKNGSQAAISNVKILSVMSPDLIDGLMKNRDAAGWVERRLNPNTVIIHAKGEKAIRRALAEMETLTDMES